MDIYNESTTACNSICQEIAFMIDQSAYVYSTDDMHYSTGTYCILTELPYIYTVHNIPPKAFV